MRSETIRDSLRARMSELVAERLGLHFPAERWADLERGLVGAAAEFEFRDLRSCVDWLLSAALSKSEVEILASHLTVGETYFFREKKAFDALAEHVLPALARLRA